MILFRHSETDTASDPVNQWVVAGEPVISKNGGAGCIYQSNKEIELESFPCWETYQEQDSGIYDGCRGSIEESEFMGFGRGSSEIILPDEFWAHKTMRGP